MAWLDLISGVAIGLVCALCVMVYGLNDANQELQASNTRLIGAIIDIQTEQAKSERIAEKAMRRQVRKIAAKEAAK